MFLSFWGSFLAVVVLTSQSHSAEGTRKCQFKRKHDVYYSPNASHSHGKILKRLNSSNEDECQRICCGLHNCTLYMYSRLNSSNLHRYDANCLLFFCRNNSLCHTRPLPGNITGISIIGTQQGDFAIDSMVNNGSKDVTITQLQVTHSFLSNSTISSFTTSSSTISSFTISLSPSSTMSSIRYTSSINGTTLSNSTVGQLTTHHGNNHTGSPPNAIQSQPNHLPRNHTQSIHLRKSVHSSHKIRFINGSHSSTSLDNSVNHTTHSQINISHTLSPLANSSSTLILKVVNASEDSSFSNIHLSSLSSPSTFASVSTIFMSKSPSDTLAKSNASQISPSSPTTSQISTTSVKRNHKNKFSESHTTPVSLVISLIIGILFFGTILFLIGRRWSETCLRRGYSRVDYLLNDYD